MMRKAGPWILTAAAVLAVAAVLWLKPAAPRGKSAEPVALPSASELPPPLARPAAPAADSPPPPAEPAMVGEQQAAVAPPAAEVPPPSAPAQTVRLNSGMVIASVNGVAITLKDLMPVNPSVATERTMTREMFTALLDRAVRRELAAQEARTRGIELGDEQRKQLDMIRERALERDPASFTDAHDDYAAKADFEVRDFAGLMLQESLLAAAGGPPKYVTPEAVEKYYQEHKADFGELPEDPEQRRQAWEKMEIDIRNAMAGDVEAMYQRELQSMMDGLKQKADVSSFVDIP
jgi:hypothetical protein